MGYARETGYDVWMRHRGRWGEAASVVMVFGMYMKTWRWRNASSRVRWFSVYRFCWRESVPRIREWRELSRTNWIVSGKLFFSLSFISISLLFLSIYDFEDSSSKFVVVDRLYMCISIYSKCSIFCTLNSTGWNEWRIVQFDNLVRNFCLFSIIYFLLLVFKVKVHVNRKLSYFCERFIYIL